MAKKKIAKSKSPAKKATGGKDVEDGKVCAALSYLLIGIIWFFVDDKMKKNAYVKFHVKQGLVLLIASIALAVVFNILTVLLGLIFWQLVYLLANILNLAILVFAILGIINAVNGKQTELPIIGQYASKLTF